MELVVIGKTHKPTGLKGEIQLIVNEEYLVELEHLEVLFIKTYGRPTPYFIEHIRVNNNLPLVKLEEIENKEVAKKLSAKEISVRKSDLRIPEEERIIPSSLNYAFLVNYTMNDEVLGSLGTIKEVLEFPQQEMAVVDFKGKEVFIPLNPTFLQNIDKTNKKALVKLPEGMLEL